MSSPQFEERFWGSVDSSGGPGACWPWLRGRFASGGYGQVRVPGERVPQRAHRLAFAMTKGTIAPGMVVCHACDNPPCCNPSHLFLGTQQQNIADMERKGRARRTSGGASFGPRNGMNTHPERRTRGERSGTARLTTNDVLRIRAEYANGGVSQRSLAAKFGVTQTQVSGIVTRKQWAHV